MADIRYTYLPAPDPYAGADRCPACQGAGVTGTQYDMSVDEGRTIIVVDDICPRCQGCGRDANHRGCTPEQHVGWEPDDDHLDDDGDDQPCWSCHGRRWHEVIAFTENKGPMAMLYLRMPCGCAEPLMVEVTR